MSPLCGISLMVYFLGFKRCLGCGIIYIWILLSYFLSVFHNRILNYTIPTIHVSSTTEFFTLVLHDSDMQHMTDKYFFIA